MCKQEEPTPVAAPLAKNDRGAMFMSFWNRLTPKAAGPSQASKVVTRTVPPSPKKTVPGNVTPILAAKSSRTFPSYSSLSDIPPFSEVVSDDGGIFEVPVKQREFVLIVKLEKADNTYCLISTKEHYGSAVFVGTIKRIQLTGALVSHADCGIADQALIYTVYQQRVGLNGINALGDDVAPIAKAIDDLVQESIDRRSSDIHIEKRSTQATVRMRVFGRVQVVSDSWDPEYVMRFARAMYTLADEDSKDTSFQPDGQMAVTRLLPSGIRVKLRVQLSTAYPDDGMDVVIRVLRVGATAKIMSPQELGYAPDHNAMIEFIENAPSGATFIAGTTGSGKSTSLQTMMLNIRDSGRGLKLITIEDPPEYVLDGITQIPVVRRKAQDTKENPFAQAMRATMRMDPDVIMVGEIRDNESAALSVGMVQSGHKVLTTIHADSAFGIVARLSKMGLDAQTLSARGYLNGFMYQKLVPVLCPHCRVEYDTSCALPINGLHDRIKYVASPGDTIFLESEKGCEHCNFLGVVDRTVCAEIVIPDEKILEHLREDNVPAAYKYWRSLRKGKSASSMLGATALEHAVLKMRQGVVSPVDVEKEFGMLTGHFIEDLGSGILSDDFTFSDNSGLIS